jgi:hypothetical protein
MCSFIHPSYTKYMLPKLKHGRQQEQVHFISFEITAANVRRRVHRCRLVAASTLTSLQKGQTINGNPVTSSTTLSPPCLHHCRTTLLCWHHNSRPPSRTASARCLLRHGQRKRRQTTGRLRRGGWVEERLSRGASGGWAEGRLRGCGGGERVGNGLTREPTRVAAGASSPSPDQLGFVTGGAAVREENRFVWAR